MTKFPMQMECTSLGEVVKRRVSCRVLQERAGGEQGAAKESFDPSTDCRAGQTRRGQ